MNQQHPQSACTIILSKMKNRSIRDQFDEYCWGDTDNPKNSSEDLLECWAEEWATDNVSADDILVLLCRDVEDTQFEMGCADQEHAHFCND